MSTSGFVTSGHILFGNPVVINYLSQTYTIQVKNAVALKEKNRTLSIKAVSARRCNFGHISTFYIAFSAYI